MMLLHLSPPSEVITCGRAPHGMAEVIPELMMGRSRAGHLNFASLGISLPPNFLIASRSRREGGELEEEKTGGRAGLTIDGERFRFDERGATRRRRLS